MNSVNNIKIKIIQAFKQVQKKSFDQSQYPFIKTLKKTTVLKKKKRKRKKPYYLIKEILNTT